MSPRLWKSEVACEVVRLFEALALGYSHLRSKMQVNSDADFPERIEYTAGTKYPHLVEEAPGFEENENLRPGSSRGTRRSVDNVVELDTRKTETRKLEPFCKIVQKGFTIRSRWWIIL